MFAFSSHQAPWMNTWGPWIFYVWTEYSPTFESSTPASYHLSLAAAVGHFSYCLVYSTFEDRFQIMYIPINWATTRILDGQTTKIEITLWRIGSRCGSKWKRHGRVQFRWLQRISRSIKQHETVFGIRWRALENVSRFCESSTFVPIG